MNSTVSLSQLAKRITKLRQDREELNHRLRLVDAGITAEQEQDAKLDEEILRLRQSCADAQLRCVLAKLSLDRDALLCDEFNQKISETRKVINVSEKHQKIAGFIESQLQAAVLQRGRQAAALKKSIPDKHEVIRSAMSKHESQEHQLTQSIVQTTEHVDAMMSRRQLIDNALRDLQL